MGGADLPWMGADGVLSWALGGLPDHAARGAAEAEASLK